MGDSATIPPPTIAFLTFSSPPPPSSLPSPQCTGYAAYLRQCPSFVHNICHEDIGGSERLRAPCPDFLKCYYCLRINPLYCLD